MSIDPSAGIRSSLASSTLAQTLGPEVTRSQQALNTQQRRDQSDTKATKAAGVGEADGEDHRTADRDADGRRLWKKSSSAENHTEDVPQKPEQQNARNFRGACGNIIDLSG